MIKLRKFFATILDFTTRYIIYLVFIIMYKVVGEAGFYAYIILVLLIVFSYWIIYKSVSITKKPLFLSYALMFGHALWGSVSIVFLFSLRQYNLINFFGLIVIGLILALVVWLILRPGLISGIATLIFLAIEILLLSFSIAESENNLTMKRQLMHLTLFAITFISMVQGLYLYRKSISQTKEENQLSLSSNISP